MSAYLLLFLSSFLAATVIPFSSEVHFTYLLYLGYSPALLLVVATVGNTAGGVLSYYLGWLCHWEWLKKYFGVNPVKIQAWKTKIDRYLYWLALLAWLPMIGDVIIIALGVFRISPWKCISLMLVGKFFRYFVLTLVLN